PVDAGTISTNLSGTKDAASQEVKKDVSFLRYIALPNWAHDALLKFSSSKPQDHYSTEVLEDSGNPNPIASTSTPPAGQMETLTVDTLIPIVSSPVPTAYSTDSQEPSSDARLIKKELLIKKKHHPWTTFYHCQIDPSWVEAMQDKLLQFKIQKVWTLVDCPKREEGIDYDEVFAPVARIEAIRLFLAYASFMGFTLYQMDVKSAFLYGTIDEEVYVMQPPRFQDPEYPARVYKVEKAMYGLHKAPRAWYGTLSKYLFTNGFQRDTIDQTLFIRRQRGDFILVQVYVDNIIFGSSNPQLCKEFKALMHEKFQMSAMGELNFFLGLQVLQKEDGIFLSQDKDCFEKKLINVDHIHTDENVADLLTKPFNAGRLQYLV
nr:putative ribonuclease H-like domain-containing protein [Tanacetum cinerariifolium]